RRSGVWPTSAAAPKRKRAACAWTESEARVPPASRLRYGSATVCVSAVSWRVTTNRAPSLRRARARGGAMARLESAKDRIELRNGTGVPCVGFGTWELPEGDAGLGALRQALADGYRHIDTAEAYGTEADVGRALRESGIAREE